MRKSLWSNPAQIKRSWYMFFFQLPLLPEWFFTRDGGRSLAQGIARQATPGAFTQQDLDRYIEGVLGAQRKTGLARSS